MNYDLSLLNYFFHASLVVQVVMLILVGISIVSWSYILHSILYLQDINKVTGQFEKSFWSGDSLSDLYAAHYPKRSATEGLPAIFFAGYKEFQRFRKQANASLSQTIDNTKRAMDVAKMREQEKMENHLSFFAIAGSTSPYIGLFGTVWGIMQAFKALSNVQQVSIAMVAPGIAEALVATALGLFAAIPAVIAYNRFVNQINRLMNRFDAFSEEFVNILIRQHHLHSNVIE